MQGLNVRAKYQSIYHLVHFAIGQFTLARHHMPPLALSYYFKLFPRLDRGAASSASLNLIRATSESENDSDVFLSRERPRDSYLKASTENPSNCYVRLYVRGGKKKICPKP